jgi:hypothetical protein
MAISQSYKKNKSPRKWEKIRSPSKKVLRRKKALTKK